MPYPSTVTIKTIHLQVFYSLRPEIQVFMLDCFYLAPFTVKERETNEKKKYKGEKEFFSEEKEGKGED